MPLVAAFEEMKAQQLRRVSDKPGTTGEVLYTPMLGASDQPGLPHAALAHFAPGRISRSHFHVSDQFQVVIAGQGTLGRHDLGPYTVHFARAYTPYGPIVSGAGTGLTFFVMRAHADPGSQRLPQELEQLNAVPNRQPWQIHRRATFPTLLPGKSPPDALLEPIPDIKDEHGLAAHTLRMRPNSTIVAPDPAHGDGQYIVVVKGGLYHNGRGHPAPALVFIRPDECRFQICAGAEGLEAIVLNYPARQVRIKDRDKDMQAKTGFQIWKCSLCEFDYDEAAGLPAEGIAPGTRWRDIPERWTCPDCSASKSDFHMMEAPQ